MSEQPVVLYVEDDPQSRRVMHMLLRRRMELPHVTIFEDSNNFIERVEALNPRPTLILLDIHVPPHDGFTMLQMLRKLEWTQHVPIVALTASVMNEEVNRLQTAGFNGCFAKPIDLATFPQSIEHILTGSEIWRIIE